MARRGEGKIVTHVEWEKDGVKRSIPIRLVTDKTYGRTAGMRFYASDDEADVSVFDTDIEKVRKKIIEALDAWHSVSYTLWFRIEAYGSGEPNVPASDLTLKWRWIIVGTNKHGKTFHREMDDRDNVAYIGNTLIEKKSTAEWRKLAVEKSCALLSEALERLPNDPTGGRSRNRCTHDGMPKSGKMDETWRGRGVGLGTVVPATVETLKRLFALKYALDDVRERVNAIVDPGNVERFITGKSQLALTAGKDDK